MSPDCADSLYEQLLLAALLVFEPRDRAEPCHLIPHTAPTAQMGTAVCGFQVSGPEIVPDNGRFTIEVAQDRALCAPCREHLASAASAALADPCCGSWPFCKHG